MKDKYDDLIGRMRSLSAPPKPRGQKVSFIRKTLRKYGVWGSVVLTALLASLLSVILVLSIMLPLGIPHLEFGILVAMFCTMVVTPIISYSYMQLLVQLDKAEQRLRVFATEDDLTGAYNRRHFIELSRQELIRAKRYNYPISVLLFDIDHFKKINDGYGHHAGDKVLRKLGKICLSFVRENDFIGRLGGEEFAVFLPHTGGENAVHAAKRLLKALDTEIEVDGHQISISVSIGVAASGVVEEEDMALEELLRKADSALYHAKRSGRNQISVGPEPSESP